ncbi:hypothetical protein NPIL_390811 [Nephila pilipes]|uniref:Uncharacterized protein n=1 Tax=Nephila pilipes TaxID=299642 RepID=A0A8X6T656_NEPPI|nr:hypothetical protein NPIL_390811 [Nephila pilipes]
MLTVVFEVHEQKNVKKNQLLPSLAFELRSGNERRFSPNEFKLPFCSRFVFYHARFVVRNSMLLSRHTSGNTDNSSSLNTYTNNLFSNSLRKCVDAVVLTMFGSGTTQTAVSDFITSAVRP